MCFPHKGKTSSGSLQRRYWVSHCLCWGGKKAEPPSLALAAPSSHAPTQPPLLPLPHPHSSERSSSGPRINLFQWVAASHLGELVAGFFFFFSRRHFCPMLLNWEDSSVSRHLLWRSNKQMWLWLLGPTFLSNWLEDHSLCLSPAADFLHVVSWHDFSYRLII